jgi:hypothetical protein
MTQAQNYKFEAGDEVFVRWHGPDIFTVVESFLSSSGNPHYKCGKFASGKWEYWNFPQQHLSSQSIEVATKSSNRKQLEIPMASQSPQEGA